MKVKLIKRLTAGTIILTTLTFAGCTKKIDCPINDEHVHIYIDEKSGISRYIDSEKVNIDNYVRTSDYLPIDEKLKIISENKLCLIEENKDYLNTIFQQYFSKRKAYVYTYGTYEDTKTTYTPEGISETRRVIENGWHYEWQEIPFDEYTEDLVYDITYQFEFYKILNNGEVVKGIFRNLEELPDDYKYFKEKSLVQTIVSDEYYLKDKYGEKELKYKNKLE